MTARLTRLFYDNNSRRYISRQRADYELTIMNRYRMFLTARKIRDEYGISWTFSRKSEYRWSATSMPGLFYNLYIDLRRQGRLLSLSIEIFQLPYYCLRLLFRPEYFHMFRIFIFFCSRKIHKDLRDNRQQDFQLHEKIILYWFRFDNNL